VFASAMQMDPKTFGEIQVANMLECCPRCSTVSRSSKSDDLFRSDDREASRQSPVQWTCDSLDS